MACDENNNNKSMAVSSSLRIPLILQFRVLRSGGIITSMTDFDGQFWGRNGQMKHFSKHMLVKYIIPYAHYNYL